MIGLFWYTLTTFTPLLLPIFVEMKSYLIKFLIAILLFIVTAYVGSFDLELKLILLASAYTIASYYLLYSSTSVREIRLSLLILSLPILIVYVPIHSLMYEGSAISLPSNLFSLLGILFGVVLFYTNRMFKIIFFIIFISITLWSAHSGYELWFYKINYGLFQAETHEILKDVKFYDSSGKILSKNDLSNKIKVLDFWNTSCAECFRRFPTLQKTYSNYRSSKDVAVYAVNIPLKRDKVNQAVNALSKRNYSFPLLIATDNSVAKTLGVLTFPTVMVLDKHTNIVYRGSIDGASQQIEKLRFQTQ